MLFTLHIWCCVVVVVGLLGFFIDLHVFVVLGSGAAAGHIGALLVGCVGAGYQGNPHAQPRLREGHGNPTTKLSIAPSHLLRSHVQQFDVALTCRKKPHSDILRNVNFGARSFGQLRLSRCTLRVYCLLVLQVKCHKYYPSGEPGDVEMRFDDVDLRVTFMDEQDASYFTVRTLQLEDLRVSAPAWFSCVASLE